MTLNQEVMALAFNEWMRRYTEEPERFEREWRTVAKFLAEKSADETPSYGRSSAAYLVQLAEEVTHTSKPEPPPAPPPKSS